MSGVIFTIIMPECFIEQKKNLIRKIWLKTFIKTKNNDFNNF